jgi:ribonuclease PH
MEVINHILTMIDSNQIVMLCIVAMLLYSNKEKDKVQGAELRALTEEIQRLIGKLDK